MLPPPLMLTIKNRVRDNLVVILLTAFALLTGCMPPGPRALLEGKRLIDQGKYPQAMEELRTATTLLGTNAQACAQAWNYLGLACHHLGQADAAANAYQRALSLNHDLSEVRYNLGCLWLEQNKLESARAELTAYTLRRSNSVEGFLKLATVQTRSRDFSAAEKSLNEALRLSPQNPEALNGLGLVRLQQRRPAEAAQCFNNALKQRPDYRPALLNSAIVSHQYLKDLPLALQRYREYLALRPPPANVEALAATVRQLELELNPPARPVPPAKVVQLTPNTSPPKPAATNVTRVASPPKPEPATNVPKPLPPPTAPKPAPTIAPAPSPTVAVVKLPAEPVIRPAQEVSVKPAPVQPSPVEPLITTSSVPPSAAGPKTAKRGLLDRVNPLNLFRSEEKTPPRLTPLPPATASNAATRPAPAARPAPPAPGGALSHYNYRFPAKPQPGNRSEAERFFAQGLQAQQARRLTDAAQAYRQATQLDPGFFEAQYNLGLASTEAGNLGAALTAYEYALAIQPNSAEARYNFALVLKQANCLADAMNELERLLAIYPNAARAHLALGNLYAQSLRQPDKARQHYLRVLELEPRSPQASAVRYWLKDNPK
jgi:tetratricopeptide (TPR) repeat protein